MSSMLPVVFAVIRASNCKGAAYGCVPKTDHGQEKNPPAKVRTDLKKNFVNDLVLVVYLLADFGYSHICGKCEGG